MNLSEREGPRRSELRRWLPISLGVLAAIIVTLITAAGILTHAQSVRDRKAHAELQKRLEAIKKSGRPMIDKLAGLAIR
jgi:hypothetical protein